MENKKADQKSKKKKKKVNNSIYKKTKTLIKGVFPYSYETEHKEYYFWASNILLDQNVKPGDLVSVNCKRKDKNGRFCIQTTPLYVTGVESFKKGGYMPTQLARCKYQGERYKDFHI